VGFADGTKLGGLLGLDDGNELGVELGADVGGKLTVGSNVYPSNVGE